MKKIILSLSAFLFLNCLFAQEKKEKEPAGRFSKLLDHGNFAPARKPTAAVLKYQNFKKGWLIDLNMNEFQGSFADTYMACELPPPPELFNVRDVNIARWADSAVANGIDYVVFTVENEYGFKLWPSQTPYLMERMYLPDGPDHYRSPAYYNYNVRAPADTQILQKFVSEFRKRGIEPIPYLNSMADLNVLYGGLVPAENIGDKRSAQFQNYMFRLCQELIIRFGFKYIWIDYAAPMTPGLYQGYYNAVKSADPACTVIGNSLGETDFARFPYDIESTEEHAIYAGNIGYQTNMREHNGVSYYIGQEIVATPYGSMSQWYYYDHVRYLPTRNPFTNKPPWTNLLETPVEKFQSVADSATKYKRPFLACMLVDKKGNLVKSNLDYLRKIQFQKE